MGKKKKKRSGSANWPAVLAGVILLAGGFVCWRYLSDNKLPNFRKEAVIYVYPDTTPDDVYSTLIREAGVRRPYSLDRMFKDKQVAQYMKPGRYEVKPSCTSVYVARMLNNGWQTPGKLVLSGTMRLKEQLASKISSQLLLDSLEVIRALEDRALLGRFGFTPSDVFSLFIPDTYEMYWTATMEDVLARQKEAYDAFWTGERRAKAKARGLSVKEVSILASIVKGETNYEPEMPKIAGVYLNRLDKGMKLQADPTVAYCLGYKTNRIYRRDLKIDSPYNTYLHEGLPPGPIAVPTRACLDAVLNPEGSYMYFCANSTFDGTHLFAVSYSDHLKNARAFQKALDNKKNNSL